MLQVSHPGHLFALALFASVGLSHTFRPRIWKQYVAWIVAQGHAGVAIYASFHALPGAVLLALAGAGDWTGWTLTIIGASLVFKGALYTLFPDVAIRQMTRGLALPDAAWGIAGAAFLVFAAIGAWGLRA